jgi:hypothetical protein
MRTLCLYIQAKNGWLRKLVFDIESRIFKDVKEILSLKPQFASALNSTQLATNGRFVQLTRDPNLSKCTIADSSTILGCSSNVLRNITLSIMRRHMPTIICRQIGASVSAGVGVQCSAADDRPAHAWVRAYTHSVTQFHAEEARMLFDLMKSRRL